MKNKQYLIALDLDGTLFKSFSEYDELSTNYLKQLAKDHKIIIATGRPYRSSIFYHEILGLDTPIANYNGALIQNRLDKNFPKTMLTIPKSELTQFINVNKDIVINAFCEIEDNIYLYREQEAIVPYLHLEGGLLHVGDLGDILPSNPNGALIFVKENSEEQINNYINTHSKGIIKIRFWKDKDFIICELYNPLVSKGEAIKQIATYYNIPKEQIIAIGDGHNDIEMIQSAEYGVAMANSHPELLKIAPITTASITDHGVYQYLKNFFEGDDC